MDEELPKEVETPIQDLPFSIRLKRIEQIIMRSHHLTPVADLVDRELADALTKRAKKTDV